MRGLAWFCSIVISVLSAGDVRGQNAPRQPQHAAQPDAAWTAAVSQFAQALVGNDPGAIAPLLSDAANIHSINGRTSDALRLLASARQCILLSARPYLHAPSSAAGDIADAFRDASVPPDVKHLMIPVDDAELRRANATAAQ